MTIPKRNLGESEQWGRATEREMSDIWRRLRALEGGRRISSKSQSILADLVARNSIQDQLLQDELDFQNTVTYANTPPTEDIDDPGDPDEDGEVFPPPDSEEGENPANPGDIEEGGDDEDPYPDFEENEIEPLPNDRWVYVDPETGNVEGEWELIDEVWEARQMGTGGIAPGAIDVDRIADDAITAQKIADDAVVAGKIAAEAVDSNAIQNAAIVADKLASNAVTETKISDNAISTPKLQANAVEAGNIAAGAVIAGKIAANAVDADQIAANAVQAGKIDANAVQAGNIAAGAVTTGKLAANAVTSEKIEALAIEADHLAANAVTADKILANAIGTEKLAADAVTADKIAANAVTADNIRGNAIDGMTITGATLRTAASGARTQITSAGLQVYNSSNQELVRVGHGISTGMSVRNPGTNALTPLAPVIFGTTYVNRTTTWSLTRTTTGGWSPWNYSGQMGNFVANTDRILIHCNFNVPSAHADKWIFEVRFGVATGSAGGGSTSPTGNIWATGQEAGVFGSFTGPTRIPNFAILNVVPGTRYYIHAAGRNHGYDTAPSGTPKITKVTMVVTQV